MSMRYLVRRDNFKDYSDLTRQIQGLDSQLGKPGENFKRYVEVRISTSQYVIYQFSTFKEGNDWKWACPSQELVAESEKDFYKLAEKLSIPKTKFSHLPQS